MAEKLIEEFRAMRDESREARTLFEKPVDPLNFLAALSPDRQRGLALHLRAESRASSIEAALSERDRAAIPEPLPDFLLPPLLETMLLIECRSRVRFEGIEGVVVPLAFHALQPDPGCGRNEPLTPEAARRIEQSLGKQGAEWRIEIDWSRLSLGASGHVPVRLKAEPSKFHRQSYSESLARPMEETMRWVSDRPAWLRLPGWTADAVPASVPQRQHRRSGSSWWVLGEQLLERFRSPYSDPERVERIGRVLTRVDLRIERCLASAPDRVAALPQFALYVDTDTPFLVLEYPTGVKVGGQVGGGSCCAPRVQGLALPLASEPWMTALGGICHRHDLCGGGRAMSPHLQAGWPDQKGTSWRIDFDPRRASEGMEAWYPVVVRATDAADPMARWLDGRRGWMLMPDNCD